MKITNINDFILKVEGFNNLQPSEMIDYFVYYLINFDSNNGIKAKDIEKCFNDLNTPSYSNISKYLSENSKRVKGKTQKYLKKDMFYSITRQFNEVIAQKIVIDAHEVEINNNLRELVDKLQNSSEKIFLEEAIKTFEVGAFRAAIIMVWLLTLDHLFEYILANKVTDFIAALRRINNNKSIHIKDDFNELKESTFIEACRGANIISNDVRKILDTKLGIRNSYAHPSTVLLPKSKALEFIDDLVNNVILKY